MDTRQRIAMQRALTREAMGKLCAAIELFGVEDGAVAHDGMDEMERFEAKVREFEEWVFSDSPIA